MEALKSLLSEFDPAALMPKLDTVLGKIELIARLAVLIGPLVLLVLTVVMLLSVSRYRKMQADAMILSALHCILWEIGLVLVSRIGVDAVLMRFFDKDGNRRPGKKK